MNLDTSHAYTQLKKNDFRKKISEAIKITDWLDLMEANRQLLNQINLIEEIGLEHQHSISIVKQTNRNAPTSYNYTCYMHTFDLMDHRILKDIASGSNEIYPRAEFVLFLIRDFLHEFKKNEVEDGSIVIYFNEGKPVHAGKWSQGRVISKWGKYSHLWQHGVYEVPLEYGDSVRFFEKLESNEIENAYKKWAESKLSM